MRVQQWLSEVRLISYRAFRGLPCSFFAERVLIFYSASIGNHSHSTCLRDLQDLFCPPRIFVFLRGKATQWGSEKKDKRRTNGSVDSTFASLGFASLDMMSNEA